MPVLNLVSTDSSSPAGESIPNINFVAQTIRAGYNYGQSNNPTGPSGNGFLEFGNGVPGSLPFQVDQGGNVNANAINAPGLGLYNPVSYGADPSGVAASTAAFAKIATLIGTTANVLVTLPPGIYKTASLPAFVQNQSMEASGSATTTIKYTGSTLALSIGINGAFTGAQQGGTFSGFTLDMSGATGTPTAIQYGQVQRLRIQDVYVFSCAGKGLYGFNPSGWAEQANIQVGLITCAKPVVFDTSSFDYTNFDLTIVSTIGGGGVTLQNGAQLQGGNLRMRGNYLGQPGNTSAVIDIDPGNTAGTSYIVNTAFDVAVETDGSGVGPFTVRMGSQNSQSQFTLNTGVLSFKNTSINFQGISNPNFLPFGFNGTILDQAYGQPTPGAGQQVIGACNINESHSANLFAFNIYIQTGDIQSFVLANGVNTIVLNGASGFSQRLDFYIIQPSSGAAGTITWPANVKWPNGAAPTLSTTNNYIDHVRLVYLPSTSNFMAELVGLHYS
jgi:hypothetical protein